MEIRGKRKYTGFPEFHWNETNQKENEPTSWVPRNIYNQNQLSPARRQQDWVGPGKLYNFIISTYLSTCNVCKLAGSPNITMDHDCPYEKGIITFPLPLNFAYTFVVLQCLQWAEGKRQQPAEQKPRSQFSQENVKWKNKKRK